MNHRIAVIGLGYVGLPLARLFADRYAVVGYDINSERVEQIQAGKDKTGELTEELLQSVLIFHNPFSTSDDDANRKTSDFSIFANDSTTQRLNDLTKTGLYCTIAPDDIRNASIYIVTVPTPVDKNNRPNLTPLYKASETVGKVLKKGDIVIYESTVYPGVTEEECVPVLEKASGLHFNVDFFCGYSPERINPGDKVNTVEKIVKVTSGSTPETGRIVDDLYKTVIVAGTHLAPSIKVAEASKVIENAQRDINIAFVNELAKIFSLMDIDTQEVLKAAGTKWNFLPFKPGLVGGQCIGVDPFYLAQKAQEIGYYSELILSARRLNDSMGSFVASQIVKQMIKKGVLIKGAKILNLGMTFKENCPDIRNTKAIDVVTSLEEYGIQVLTWDPWADCDEVMRQYGVPCINTNDSLKPLQFDAVVLTVAHSEYLTVDLKSYLKNTGLVYDVKGILTNSDYRL